MKLAALQDLFWQSVRAQRAPTAVKEEFVARGELSAVKRMQIYRSAYWSRHEKCLQETYPEVLSRVGGTAFRTLVAGYVTKHPSTSPAIEQAGSRFAEFVAEQIGGDDIDETLADLAKLEWARVHALTAPNPTGLLTAAAFREAGAAEKPVLTVPALVVLQLRTDRTQVAARWIAVWRGRDGVRETELIDEEGRALTRAVRGETLAAVCDEFADPDATTRAATTLGRWIDRGWLQTPENTDAN